MQKGVEITFQLAQSEMNDRLVTAIANLAGNRLKESMEIDWRIFRVRYGHEEFYRVLFSGSRVNLLHPHTEREIRQTFDETAHGDAEKVIGAYEHARKDKNFHNVPLLCLKEEYDLWDDKLWEYL